MLDVSDTTLWKRWSNKEVSFSTWIIRYLMHDILDVHRIKILGYVSVKSGVLRAPRG
jgi:hypothetical protein